MRKVISAVTVFLVLIILSSVSYASIPTDAVSLITHYAMWSEMLGEETFGKPHSYQTKTQPILEYELVAVKYDPSTLQTVSSTFELMVVGNGTSSERILRFMAYLAAHEFGEIPDDYATYKSQRAKLFDWQELAADTLEKEASQLIAGNTLHFYASNSFKYTFQMDRDTRTIFVNAIPNN